MRRCREAYLFCCWILDFGCCWPFPFCASWQMWPSVCLLTRYRFIVVCQKNEPSFQSTVLSHACQVIDYIVWTVEKLLKHDKQLVLASGMEFSLPADLLLRNCFQQQLEVPRWFSFSLIEMTTQNKVGPSVLEWDYAWHEVFCWAVEKCGFERSLEWEEVECPFAWISVQEGLPPSSSGSVVSFHLWHKASWERMGCSFELGPQASTLSSSFLEFSFLEMKFLVSSADVTSH